MTKKLGVILILGLLSYPQICFSQDDVPVKEQLKMLDEQSNTLIKNFAAERKSIEDELNAQIKALSSSPEDREKRAAFVRGANKRIKASKQNFKIQLDTLNEAKFALHYGGKGGPEAAKRAYRNRMKTRSVDNLQEKIKKQDMQNRSRALSSAVANRPTSKPRTNINSSAVSKTPPPEINAKSLKKLDDFRYEKPKRRSLKSL